jgi:hypothetical protein
VLADVHARRTEIFTAVLRPGTRGYRYAARSHMVSHTPGARENGHCCSRALLRSQVYCLWLVAVANKLNGVTRSGSSQNPEESPRQRRIRSLSLDVLELDVLSSCSRQSPSSLLLVVTTD